MIKNYVTNIIVILLFGITIAGMVGMSIPETRTFYMDYTPEYLLLLFVVLMIYHKPWNRRFFTALIVILTTSLMIEIIGVNCGIPFGSYSYGSIFGITLCNTPLIIAINWFLLIYSIYVISSFLQWHFLFRSLFGAGVVVLYDYIMEPVATQLNWWNWSNSTIPNQNYIAWFAFSFIVLLLLHLNRIKVRNRMAAIILSVIFVFFIGLRLIMLFDL